MAKIKLFAILNDVEFFEKPQVIIIKLYKLELAKEYHIRLCLEFVAKLYSQGSEEFESDDF